MTRSLSQERGEEFKWLRVFFFPRELLFKLIIPGETGVQGELRVEDRDEERERGGGGCEKTVEFEALPRGRRVRVVLSGAGREVSCTEQFMIAETSAREE